MKVMNEQQQLKDLAKYRTLGFTLLQLMGLVSLAGIALTVIGHFVF